MKKKKLPKPIPDSLDDLPEKIVSDEDPEEDEDDDSEEDESEPDEDKHASSEVDDSGHRAVDPGAKIRSGHVRVILPGEKDDDGKPLRPMRSEREIAAELLQKHARLKAGKVLCRHQNDIETCSLGCGAKRRLVEQVMPWEEKKIPTATATQLTEQFKSPLKDTKPEEEKSPPTLTVEQLRKSWGLTPGPKPLGGAIPKPERKITAKGLGVSGTQILEWQGRVIDVDTVIEWDLRPVLKPAPADFYPELEKELAAWKSELEIKTQQHRDLTAAGQKRAAATGQAPFDPKRREEFMQVAYRAKITAGKRIREIQGRLRELKKASEDWGCDIAHWTVERVPESKREVIVEHSLASHSPKSAAKYRDFAELRDTWEEDLSLRIPIHPEKDCWPHTTLQQEYFYPYMRRETWEQIVILCAYLLRWFDPPEELLRKFPKLHDLKNKRQGTFGWPVDWDTEAEDVGAEETQSILKDGGASARLTVHGNTWKRLKTLETFARFASGPDGESGDGFYGGMDSGDYNGEEE